METAGTRLKKLRQEKGLSLEEAQKKTRIHLDILKSIEEDSLVNLNPVYIKGFVKIYCSFLKVPPEEYLCGYQENGMVIPASPPEKKEDKFSWVGRRPKKTFLNPRIVVMAVSAVVLLLLILGGVALVKFISKPRPKNPRQQLVLPKPTKKVDKKNTLKPKTALPVPATKAKSEAVSSASSGVSAPALNLEPEVRISLNALDDCWVQARLDGKTIFQNILKKGRFESWSAKDKVELSLGSAGSVRLEVNGKLIPSLGRKGQVLKNILITKDGLKVGK
jgi:cytoskeleton protein RodZ